VVGNANWDAQHGHGGHQPPDHGGPPGISVSVDRQLAAVDAVKNENCKSKDGYEVLVAEPEVVVGRETEHGSHVVIETVDPVHPPDGNALAHGHPEQGDATGGVSVVEFEQINSPLGQQRQA